MISIATMVLVLLGFSTPAFAVELSQDERVRHDDLMVRYRDHMNHVHVAGERGTCLTGLIMDLKTDWELFSPEEKIEITGALAPHKQDLVEPIPPAPEGCQNATCWGYQKDNYIDTEHFSVQWDDGMATEADAQAFADSLEESWEIEINELGWREPSGSDRFKMLVMIDDIGGGAGAYTTVENCSGGYRPYVVASTGSFDAGNWYKTMACHELHHAIQYAYGFAHEFWWWEATATWVEDLVYPYANDWATALYMFSQSPHLGMNASAGGGRSQDLFWHTYGMGIWGMFLDQHVGGNELVKETWEETRPYSCQYCAWMPDIIEDVGEDFDGLMVEFLARTSVMDYRDRMYLTDAQRADNVDELPADGEANSDDRPQSLGMNIIEFDKDLGESGKALEVTFDGANSADYWIAVLARGNASLEEYVVFELDSDGDGTAQIAFEGDEPIQLVVSPVYEDAQGYSYSWSRADDFNYEWSAELVDITESGSSEDTGSADRLPFGDDGDVADGGEIKGGCNCSTGGVAPIGMALPLLGLMVAVRRRQ